MYVEYIEDVISKLPGSVYWKDKNGVYLGGNLKAAQMAGLSSADELVKKTDYDLFTKQQADQFKKNDEQVMHTGKEYSVEEISYLPGGEELVQLSTKKPLVDKNGNIVGIIGVTVDVTDHKRAEQLQREKELAEKATRFSNLVAGSVAHEVCTPLTGINSQIDLLNMVISTVDLPQDKGKICKDAIREIKQIIKSSVHVVRDMLLKVRSFATGKLHHSDFALTSISSDIEEFLSSYPFGENEKKLIKLIGFDNLENRFKYMGDHLLTQHVLTNLLRNALFAIQIEHKGDVCIELKTSADFNLLIFRDTASGIPADFVPKIFDQFETKKTTHGGTGLGLAFCKMVMHEYGGDITCNSKEGEYTEFVLSFPKI